MELILTFEGKQAFLKIVGMLVTENAHELHEKLKEVLQSDAIDLFLDFSACRLICSKGIGKLIVFCKEFEPRGGKVEIVKCSQNVYDLFKTIKFDQIMTINL